MNWENKIDEIHGPAQWIVILNIFLIMLIIFMMSSNFAFLPGVVSSGSLPRLTEPKMIQAPKLIVTALSYETLGRTPGKGNSSNFEYSFNGITVNTFQELKKSIDEAVAQNKKNGNEPLLLLHADKTMPVNELIKFYAMARGMKAQILIVTSSEPRDTSSPSIIQEN